jgi:hypothetical protein
MIAKEFGDLEASRKAANAAATLASPAPAKPSAPAPAPAPATKPVTMKLGPTKISVADVFGGDDDDEPPPEKIVSLFARISSLGVSAHAHA